MTITIGLYGKIPHQGDFVRHALPLDWCTDWHEWMQSSLMVSREQLGQNWEELYLTSPIWRFASKNKNTSILGLMMPSVDSAGRYFPLTLALVGQCNPYPLILELEWFSSAEQILLSALHDGMTMDGLIAQIHSLPLPVQENCMDAGNQKSGFYLPLFNSQLKSSDVIQILSYLGEDVSIWHSEGSTIVESCYLIQKGMPDAASFSAFLDGQWNRWHWKSFESAQ